MDSESANQLSPTYNQALLHRLQSKSGKSPRLVGLRLEVDPSPQVLQIDGRFYHSVPASRLGLGMPTAEYLRSPGITPVHRYYVLIRHPLVFDPLPGATGYKVYPAPAISNRDEEGL